MIKNRYVVLFLALVFVALPAGLALSAVVYQSAMGAVPEFLPNLWEKIQQAGPFSTAVMIYMWTRSEAERRKLQDERDGLLERVLMAMNNGTQALRDFRIGLFGTQHEH